MNPLKYLRLAAEVSRIKDDSRTYFIGAVGIRRDGVLVCAANGCPKFPEPKHHAEVRLLRKLGKGGIVFVCRTLADGRWSNAKPCTSCRISLVNHGVRAVYWSEKSGAVGSASNAGWLRDIQ